MWVAWSRLHGLKWSVDFVPSKGKLIKPILVHSFNGLCFVTIEVTEMKTEMNKKLGLSFYPWSTLEGKGKSGNDLVPSD